MKDSSKVAVLTKGEAYGNGGSLYHWTATNDNLKANTYALRYRFSKNVDHTGAEVGLTWGEKVIGEEVDADWVKVHHIPCTSGDVCPSFQSCQSSMCQPKPAPAPPTQAPVPAPAPAPATVPASAPASGPAPSPASAMEVFHTTSTSANHSAGETVVSLADVSLIEPGHYCEFSDGTNSEEHEVDSVQRSRRLEGRRLAAGTVTLKTALQNSYASGATVKVKKAAQAVPAPAASAPATPASEEADGSLKQAMSGISFAASIAAMILVN